MRHLYLYIGLTFVMVMSHACFANKYLGIDLGIAHLASEYHFVDDITISSPKTHIVDHSGTDIGAYNYAAGLIFGLDKELLSKSDSHYLIGAEIQVHYAPVKMKNNGSSTTYLTMNNSEQVVSQDFNTLTFKSDYSLSLLLKLGFKPTDFTKVFALLGIDSAQFKANVKAWGKELRSDNSYYEASPYTHNFSKQKYAPTAGIGMSFRMKNRLMLRLAYLYSNYGTIKNKDVAPVNYTDNGVTTSLVLNHSYKFEAINRSLLTLGLVYEIGGV